MEEMIIKKRSSEYEDFMSVVEKKENKDTKNQNK